MFTSHPLTHFTSLHFTSLHFTSLHFTHFTHSHIPHSHTPHTPHSHHSLTLSLTHCTWTYIHTYIHTNSPTITAPSLLYLLFPSCSSMVSLSLKKLVTCGVIRSFNWFNSQFFRSAPAKGSSEWRGLSKIYIFLNWIGKTLNVSKSL